MVYHVVPQRCLKRTSYKVLLFYTAAFWIPQSLLSHAPFCSSQLISIQENGAPNQQICIVQGQLVSHGSRFQHLDSTYQGNETKWQLDSKHNQPTNQPTNHLFTPILSSFRPLLLLSMAPSIDLVVHLATPDLPTPGGFHGGKMDELSNGV